MNHHRRESFAPTIVGLGLRSGVNYFFCFFLFIFLYACVSPPQQPQRTGRPHHPRQPTKPSPPQGIFHVVKVKENLFRIGKAYDVDYRRLARLNRIADPAQILIGQNIFVPGATRQLPVEIITPSKVNSKPPRKPKPRGRGRNGFVWPLKGRLTSKFGRRGKSFHDGLDIAAPKGTPIRAVQKGKVLFSDKLRGYGNIVIIRHAGRYVSVYAHNRKNLARKGQRVAQWQVIGEVGSTGRVTGPHLHFEIRKNNVARDPLYYLP